MLSICPIQAGRQRRRPKLSQFVHPNRFCERESRLRTRAMDRLRKVGLLIRSARDRDKMLEIRRQWQAIFRKNVYNSREQTESSEIHSFPELENTTRLLSSSTKVGPAPFPNSKRKTFFNAEQRFCDRLMSC